MQHAQCCMIFHRGIRQQLTCSLKYWHSQYVSSLVDGDEAAAAAPQPLQYGSSIGSRPPVPPAAAAASAVAAATPVPPAANEAPAAAAAAAGAYTPAAAASAAWPSAAASLYAPAEPPAPAAAQQAAAGSRPMTAAAAGRPASASLSGSIYNPASASGAVPSKTKQELAELRAALDLAAAAGAATGDLALSLRTQIEDLRSQLAEAEDRAATRAAALHDDTAALAESVGSQIAALRRELTRPPEVSLAEFGKLQSLAAAAGEEARDAVRRAAAAQVGGRAPATSINPT